MYTTKTFEELGQCKIGSEEWMKLMKYKLCYIDEIPQTYYDYTPEAKAFRETDEWKEQDRLRDEKFKRERVLSSDDPEFGYQSNEILSRGAETQEYPHPDYIPGKQEFYAYFTPLELKDQWGDDWDGSPYEHNAGAPYDSIHDKMNSYGGRKEYEIIKVPFYVDDWVYQPKEWGGYSSPWCVRDINGGAVAWLYREGTQRKSSGEAIAVHAGVTPFEFWDKVRGMMKLTENSAW